MSQLICQYYCLIISPVSIQVFFVHFTLAICLVSHQLTIFYQVEWLMSDAVFCLRKLFVGRIDFFNWGSVNGTGMVFLM